jgi:hypothetical protein
MGWIDTDSLSDEAELDRSPPRLPRLDLAAGVLLAVASAIGGALQTWNGASVVAGDALAALPAVSEAAPEVAAAPAACDVEGERFRLEADALMHSAAWRVVTLERVECVSGGTQPAVTWTLMGM